MQLWLCCTLLAFVVGGSVAQKPLPCKSPPLFEGGISLVAQDGNYTEFTKYSYDATSQRIRFGEIIKGVNFTKRTEALLLYQEQVIYVFDYKTKTCQKQALTAKFEPIQTPPNSTFLSQTVTGSLAVPEEGVLVNTWIGQTPEVKGWYAMTLTEHGCFPVSLLFTTQKTGLVVVSYYNNVRGIRDPSVFIPPPFCKDASLKPGEGEFSVFSSESMLALHMTNI